MFSFLKHFFFKSNELCRIRHHFIYTLLFSIIIFLPDIILSKLGKISFIPNQTIILLITLFCFISSFSGCIVKILTLFYAFITQIISVNYVIITGKQIESTQILNALTNIDKVFNNFSATWWLILVILLPFVLLVFYSIFFRKEFVLSIFSLLLVVSTFGYLIYRNGIIKLSSNSKSKPTRMIVYNNLKTFPYFITHTNEKEVKIPKEFLKKNEITKNNIQQPKVILLIIADNINTDNMHLFNKNNEKENTPRLEKMLSKYKDNFYLSNSISSAIEERTSITKFFNILYNSSNANKIIKEGKQNILNIAKQNGYKTHWFGNHRNDLLEEAGIFVDDIKTYQDARYFTSFNKAQDDYLIELLRKTDISQGKHFIVLHLQTAKLNKKTKDYSKNYQHHGEVFTEWKSIDDEKTTKEDTYNNSILYLDYLLESFIEIAQKKKFDHTFFTSIRGENIRNEVKTLALSENNTPLLIYSKNIKEIKENFKNIKNNITHYELSKYLLNLIGYKIKNYYEEDNTFYIDSDIAIDNNEHLMINRDANGNITTAKKERLLDYYNNNKEKYKEFAITKKITNDIKKDKKITENNEKNKLNDDKNIKKQDIKNDSKEKINKVNNKKDNNIKTQQKKTLSKQKGTSKTTINKNTTNKTSGKK